MKFRWRNSRHMRKWSHQRFQVAEVVNNTARVDARHVSGPINLAASYTFATRLSGVTHLSAALKAATRAKFPALGPRGVPSDRRRRFFTPFDLMVYGFGPIVPVYPTRGETWRSSRDTTDWRVFGTTGRSKLLGTRRVRVPAGRYRRDGDRDDAQAARLPLRQRHAARLVRARQGPDQAGLPAPGRQRLDRPADLVNGCGPARSWHSR